MALTELQKQKLEQIIQPIFQKHFPEHDSKIFLNNNNNILFIEIVKGLRTFMISKDTPFEKQCLAFIKEFTSLKGVHFVQIFGHMMFTVDNIDMFLRNNSINNFLSDNE